MLFHKNVIFGPVDVGILVAIYLTESLATGIPTLLTFTTLKYFCMTKGFFFNLKST